MKSYIKIIGPPIFDTIKALEKIAVDMPEVCIMSPPIELTIGFENIAAQQVDGELQGFTFGDYSNVSRYFGPDIPEERCQSIISKSGEKLGDYDFYFEWFKKPNMDELKALIKKIDDAVKTTGAQYTVTTK